MSDIVCARCGEGWDQTGGLHPSHSCLDEERFKLLLEGRGCPCCQGDIENHECYDGDPNLLPDKDGKPHFVTEWQKSVERLSEGECEYMYHTMDVAPKAPVDPDEYESEW